MNDPFHDFLDLAESFRSAYAALSDGVAIRWNEIGADFRFALECANAAFFSALLDSQPMADPEAQKRRRIFVHFEFAKQLESVEHALRRGRYGVAATLLRREIEMVNTCFASRKGKQKDGMNPRIKPFPHLGKVYKDLTGVAHATKHDSVAYLAGEGPNALDPQFDRSYCEWLLMVHIHCLLAMATDVLGPMNDRVPSDFDEARDEASSLAFAVLGKHKFLVLKEAEAPKRT